MLPVYLAAVPKIEAPAWSPSDSVRGFYIGRLSGRILRGLGVLARLRDPRLGDERTHFARPSAGR